MDPGGTTDNFPRRQKQNHVVIKRGMLISIVNTSAAMIRSLIYKTRVGNVSEFFDSEVKLELSFIFFFVIL